MRAWQVPELGEPRDVLTLAEVPDPVPGPGQVLVKVLGAAAHCPDVLMCRGGYQVRPPLPYTPGVELCGEVVAAGPGVTGFAAGDRLIGGPVGGAFAELALMNAASVLPAPDGLDDAEAAAFFITYQTGWFGLHRRAGLAAGETLLVQAAAGGVGSGAVQLGKAAGARVIGVAGGEIQSVALNHALIKNYSIVGLHWGLYQSKDPQLIKDCHAQLTRLVAEGAIRPLVSER